MFAIVHRYSDPRVLAHFKKPGSYKWDQPVRGQDTRAAPTGVGAALVQEGWLSAG